MVPGRRHGVELPLLGTPWILCSSRSFFLQHEDKQQQHHGPDGGAGGEGPLMVAPHDLFSSSTPRATQPAHQASKGPDGGGGQLMVAPHDLLSSSTPRATQPAHQASKVHICSPCHATHPSVANSSHHRRRRRLKEIFPDLLGEVTPPGHGWRLRSRLHRGDGVVQPRLHASKRQGQFMPSLLNQEKPLMAGVMPPVLFYDLLDSQSIYARLVTRPTQAWLTLAITADAAV